jgi:diguanylate cyclase (GGDEF)-like protein
MARRNGRGSKSLAETISQFERSELRLLRSASKARIVSQRETERLEERFTQSSSQKRSSDVLAAAIHLNKLLAASLKEVTPEERPGAGREVEFEVLAEMGNALRAEARPADGLIRLLTLLGQLVPYNRAAVFVFDEQKGRLEPLAAVGGVVDLIEGVEFELGNGFSSWIAKRKKPTLLSDLQRPAAEGEIPLRCFMSVPVLVHGDLVGVVNLGHSEPRVFDEEHLRIVNTVAPLLGATLTREAAERLLAENAAHDPLTEVMTAKQLDRRIYEETDRSRRHGDPLTLVLLKVAAHEDFVKAHGLATADQALRELGRLLNSTVRCADPVGRVGVDEFALLLVHTTLAEARAVVERVTTIVSRHSFPRRKRLQVHAAIACFPEAGNDLAELLASARRRLVVPSSAGAEAKRGEAPGRALAPRPEQTAAPARDRDEFPGADDGAPRSGFGAGGPTWPLADTFSDLPDLPELDAD